MLKIGIELGMQTIRIFSKRKIYHDDLLLASTSEQGTVILHGREALSLKSSITPVNPFSSSRADERLLARIILDLLQRYRLIQAARSTALYISVPSLLTHNQLAWVYEKLSFYGVKEIHFWSLLEMAAAGSGYNITGPFSSCIVYIGQHDCTAGIFRKGKLVFRSDYFLNGSQADQAIYNWVVRHYNIKLSEHMIQKIHDSLFRLGVSRDQARLPVTGINARTGQETSIWLEPTSLERLFSNIVKKWAAWLGDFITHLDVEEQLDIYKRGIIGCGNIFLVPGLDDYFSKVLGTRVFITESPEDMVLDGLLKRMSEKSWKWS